jgi:hypothetical protein
MPRCALRPDEPSIRYTKAQRTREPRKIVSSMKPSRVSHGLANARGLSRCIWF